MRHFLNRFSQTLRRETMWWLHERKFARLVRTHPLRILGFEVTRRCNLECAYCGSDCTRKKDDGELSTQEWIDVIHQLAADFDPKKVFVSVIGGEPLIKEGILDIFRELNHSGFSWGIVSNGFMVTSEMAVSLVDRGMRAIALSMDAPAKLNDELRGKGATKSVANAVENLKAAGFSGKLEIMSTVTAPTVPQLAQLRTFIGELEVPFWRLTLVMPIGRAAARPDLIPNARDVRNILEFVLSARKDSITPHPEFCEECFLGNRFEGNVRPYLNQCLSGICVGGIMSNGGIGACPELGEAFIQGNIRKERFKDVWDTKYQVFRDRSWTHKDDCAGCNHYRHCKGSGLHLYATPDSKLMRCLYSMAKEAETLHR